MTSDDVSTPSALDAYNEFRAALDSRNNSAAITYPHPRPASHGSAMPVWHTIAGLIFGVVITGLAMIVFIYGGIPAVAAYVVGMVLAMAFTFAFGI